MPKKFDTPHEHRADDDKRDAVLRKMLKTPPKPHKNEPRRSVVQRKKPH